MSSKSPLKHSISKVRQRKVGIIALRDTKEK